MLIPTGLISARSYWTTHHVDESDGGYQTIKVVRFDNGEPICFQRDQQKRFRLACNKVYQLVLF